MRFDENGIRRRRKERIQQLLSMTEQMDGPTVAAKVENLSHPREMENKRYNKPFRFFVWQVYASILLVAIVGLIFQSDDPWAKTAQKMTTQFITEDTNFSKVTAWIEQRIGQFPSLIPTIDLFEQKDAIPVFSPPLVGTVVESFSPALTGIIIETGIKAEVHPIAPGWVRAVENRKGMGTVVVILHSDGKESSYGFLGEAYVQKNDWVYPDRVIGAVKEQSLFLQIRDKTVYINPLEVVPFD